MGDLINLFSKSKIQKEVPDDEHTLYVSHKTGKVTGNIRTDKSTDRLSRIRESLEKINRLMAELKQASNQHVDDGKNKY